ncbi:ribosome small subunit-dependent GTPase A [Virgibacillus sp. MSJ-26]|uniref:ribosome small subunit-dependent GTPase A n=1 Tax=Virgibacillus sp. MSJ-26 TaxID=2841522 RepID=UPI001C10475C|nr:ribosome small subunit-dependent GTPase A [Virgibacillus sp. MSJ-26]MBU5467695.1 ribosome small subunit-dependent GTPase A [Virgibacillus sp. MSJ-26]
MQEGRIIKSLSGFYTVSNQNGTYECKGRGVFRKRKVTPLVGDIVQFELDENEEGYIKEIESRKNELVRPPIANVNQAITVSSAKEPDFSTKLLDRFLVLIESIGIQPIILISKTDLANEEELYKLEKFKKDYRNIGYEIQLVSKNNVEDAKLIRDYLPNQITVIAGQSGVGKSSLLNAVLPSLNLKTSDVSSSLGRGKHTTRHVELLNINGGLVADTPGFSSLNFDKIEQEELTDFFPEMKEIKNQCKFRGCMHDKEPKCAVKQAVEQENITTYRYEHYLEFLTEIRSRKPRY